MAYYTLGWHINSQYFLHTVYLGFCSPFFKVHALKSFLSRNLIWYEGNIE